MGLFFDLFVCPIRSDRPHTLMTLEILWWDLPLVVIQRPCRSWFLLEAPSNPPERARDKAA
ncbi:hypothetical protein RN69_27265 [Bradyrhizobium japonicum]|nr:hypothetical protein RN69_27265 [Bradyrhizobium japonicum]KMJ99192.1 hypothetical protein CF64_13715 [Bradyrhizobium japonicum]